jgi:hypothetical protein
MPLAALLSPLLVTVLCAVFQSTTRVCAAELAINENVVAPTHKKLYGHVDDVDFALSAAGVTLYADKLPALVGNVRLGSPAYYGGLAENDRVIAGRIADNRLYLTIERSGKKYSLSLNISAVDLTREAAARDSDLTVPMLKVPQKKAQEPEKRIEERLADYDIVLVIDTSGSMGYALTSVPQVKWRWCADYIHDFAEKMRPYLKGGITLVTFNNSYEIEHGCSPDKVAEIFKTTAPNGGTNWSSPLRHVLTDYLSGPRARPLLVAVLTDGMPNIGEPVENVIKEVTHQMHSPKEIRMTFLEIGEEYDGQALIKYLDDYLVHDGAKYDIVDSLTFLEVKDIGLSEALVQALNEKSSLLSKSDALEEQLAKLKQQIADDRKAMAQPRIRRYP